MRYIRVCVRPWHGCPERAGSQHGGFGDDAHDGNWALTHSTRVMSVGHDSKALDARHSAFARRAADERVPCTKQGHAQITTDARAMPASGVSGLSSKA